MMPADIEKHFPDHWKNDNEEGGKNLSEDIYMDHQIKKTFQKNIKWEYVKVSNDQQANEMENRATNYLNNDLTVIVYNFIDMISHARTEMEVLKELAGDERAYRHLTRSRILHAPSWTTLSQLAVQALQLMVTH